MSTPSITQPTDYYSPPSADLDVGSDAFAGTYPSIFSPRGRVTRLQLLSYIVVLSTAVQIALSLLIPALMAFIGLVGTAEGVVYMFSAGFLMLYAPLAIIWTIKRCHDFNRSGWWSIFGLVPLVSLVFLVIPGTQGGNDHGHARPNGWYHKLVMWLAIVFGVIAVIGFTAAVAIPAYQDYISATQGL